MVFDVSNKDFPRTPGRGTPLKTWQKSKFEKQREEEVLRNAHERGYLRAPTLNDIWDSIGEKCDLEDISYLNMSRICLHTVQTIDLCTRLRICVLHSNYISSFDSLSFCRDLVYLDLHNNQVTLTYFYKFISFLFIDSGLILTLRRKPVILLFEWSKRILLSLLTNSISPRGKVTPEISF